MRTNANQLHQTMKHQFVIVRLKDLGFQRSQTGKSLYELDYDEAKYELVLAEMRQIDVESDSNRWF